MHKHLLIKELAVVGPPDYHLGILSRNSLASSCVSASQTEIFFSAANLLAMAVFPALCDHISG